jgi:signal transduction histidine kinase
MLEQLVNIRTQEIKEKNMILYDQTEVLSETNTLMEERQQQIEEQTEEIKSQRDQYSLLNATKDKLFTILAHDLRNPFHVITGFTELLIKDFKILTDIKIQKYLGLIYTSSVRGNDLLENILQWSRTQTGIISFNPQKLRLSEIAEEVKSLMDSIASKKNISINQLIDYEIVVYADENMLKTILRNLISNAIKFTTADGTITLSAEVLNIDDKIEIAISDNGVGIPDTTLRKLFRIESTISTKGTAQEPGTGLGLIICKEFVEMHKGKIRVQSEVGAGTTFYFTLSTKI